VIHALKGFPAGIRAAPSCWTRGTDLIFAMSFIKPIIGAMQKIKLK